MLLRALVAGRLTWRRGRSPGSAAAAVAQVEAIERTHTTPETVARLLAENARVNRAGLAPAIGRAQATALFEQPIRAITYAPLRAEASSAGDLVLSLCDATWTDGAVARRGHAVRIWQWQDDAWRIVYDQLVPVRAPK